MSRLASATSRALQIALPNIRRIARPVLDGGDLRSCFDQPEPACEMLAARVLDTIRIPIEGGLPAQPVMQEVPVIIDLRLPAIRRGL